MLVQVGRIVAVASAVLVLGGCGGSSDNESAPTSEVVSVHLASVTSSEDAYALERRLDAMNAQKAVGQYDETRWYATADGGAAQLLASGPNADALWAAMKPVVQATDPRPGTYVVKTYGDANDPSAKQGASQPDAVNASAL